MSASSNRRRMMTSPSVLLATAAASSPISKKKKKKLSNSSKASRGSPYKTTNEDDDDDDSSVFSSSSSEGPHIKKRDDRGQKRSNYSSRSNSSEDEEVLTSDAEFSKSSMDDSSDEDTDEHTEKEAKNMAHSITAAVFDDDLICELCGVPREGHKCPYQLRPTRYDEEGSDFNPDDEREDGSYWNPKRHFLRGKSIPRPQPYDEGTWTQAMAPAHILQDEVHSYLLEKQEEEEEDDDDDPDAATTTKALQSWAYTFQKEMLQQNQRNLQHAELSETQQYYARCIHQERDALVALRAKLRLVEAESKQLEEHIGTQRREIGTNAAASRFLQGIDSLRKQPPSSQNEEE